MNLASNMYKVLKQKGQWNAPTADEEKILALETKVMKLTKDNRTAAKKGKDSADPKKDGDKVNGWRFKEPPINEKSLPKTIKNKEWWWCNNHKSWCRHKPADCRGVEAKGDRKEKGKESPNHKGDEKSTK